MNPQISVIVPVYKVEKYLSVCIDSVLHQSYADFELLLIDDGSPDNSGKICDYYQQIDPRVKVYHQDNKGVSAARNLGLDNASGKWILFADSDDWADHDWLQSYANHFSNEDDIIFQGVIVESTSNQSIRSLTSGRYVNDNVGKGILHVIEEIDFTYNSTWSKIFKRDIIEKNKIRFDTNMSLGEDMVFTSQYCCHINSISLLPEEHYHYIQSHGNLTTVKWPLSLLADWLERQELVAQELADYLKENDICLKLMQGRITSLVVKLIDSYSCKPLPTKNDRLRVLKLISRYYDKEIGNRLKGKKNALFKCFFYKSSPCLSDLLLRLFFRPISLLFIKIQYLSFLKITY